MDKVKVLADTGDRDPVECGGGLVYETPDGSITWEFWDTPEKGESFTVSRIELDDPRSWSPPDWCHFDAAEKCCDVENLRGMLASLDWKERLTAFELLVRYHGAFEFDQYPLSFTKRELETRWECHWGPPSDDDEEEVDTSDPVMALAAYNRP